MSKWRACGLFLRTLKALPCSLRLILTGSSARLWDQLLVSRLTNAAFLAIGQKAAPCQKGVIQASVANS